MDAPDQDLVRRWQAGDTEAFEILAHRHFAAVWSVALAITRDPHDAEDVAQASLLRCHERRGQCRDGARFRGWLLAITRSVAYNRLERERVRRSVDLDPDTVVSGGRSPEHDMESADLRRVLLAGMQTLSPTQREVLLLRDEQGWSHAEIAELLGISETMSRRHLSDGRAKMRQFLERAEVR